MCSNPIVMDCATIDSAKELPRNNDVKASNINNNTDNVLVVNDEAMEQVNNNPTTSGTNDNAIEQKVLEEADEDKCLYIIDKMDDQDEMTKMPSSPTMMIATTMIVKGKRTKRQRIHSPIIGENKCTNNQEDNVQVMTDEDEEMDMANCLILLAQGPSRPPLIRRNELGLFTSSRGSAMRFTSENKKPSYNNNSVYECKTCNRTFPSFQALGGHRASHKKLKITTTNNTTDNDHSFSQMVTVASSSPSPLSLQLGNINYTRSTAVAAPPTNFVAQNNSSNKNRIHECAICGAEFSSGQALGGHMRRHRGPIMPLNSSTNTHPFANTTLSLSTAANNTVAATAVESKVNGINDGFLSLDLNLPASPSPLAPIAPPPEHDETKLSKQQPQTSSGMVLSTPALVDCFY